MIFELRESEVTGTTCLVFKDTNAAWECAYMLTEAGLNNYYIGSWCDFENSIVFTKE